MRINLRDCDTPIPSVDEVMNDLIDLPNGAWNKFIPPDFSTLAGYWVQFLHLTKTVGEILSTNYLPRVIRPTVSQIEDFEVEIYECSPKADDEHDPKSRLSAFYADHLRLYQQ